MASLLISPTKVGLNRTNYPLICTGMGTTWLTTPPGFTASGVAGVSVGTATVISDTYCTLPITTGSVSGTETVTDNSTTANYNLRITAHKVPPIAMLMSGDFRRRGKPKL